MSFLDVIATRRGNIFQFFFYRAEIRHRP